MSPELEREYGRLWRNHRAREIAGQKQMAQTAETRIRLTRLLLDILQHPKSTRADRCQRTGASDTALQGDLQKALDKNLINRAPGRRGSTTAFTLTQNGRLLAQTL